MTNWQWLECDFDNPAACGWPGHPNQDCPSATLIDRGDFDEDKGAFRTLGTIEARTHPTGGLGLTLTVPRRNGGEATALWNPDHLTEAKGWIEETVQEDQKRPLVRFSPLEWVTIE